MLAEFFTYGHLAGTLSAAAGLLFFSWIMFRTRSWYVIKFFLWRMFHGKGGITDPAINSYLGDQASLMLFRFVVMHAETNRDAQELIAWSKITNVSLEVVGRAGDYFDPRRRCMQEAKARWIRADKIGFSCGLFVLVALMGLAFLSVVTSEAILRFNGSRQWFLLSSDSARALVVRSAERLDSGQCDQPIATRVARATAARQPRTQQPRHP